MRAFNAREKEIIAKIAKIDVGSMPTASRFLQDHFFTKEKQIALVAVHEKKAVLFYMKPGQFNDLEKTRKCNYELLELIVLLEYLRENRYIAMVQSPKPSIGIDCLYSEADASMRLEVKKVLINVKGDYFLKDDFGFIYDAEGTPILQATSLSEYYDLVYKNMFGLLLPSEDLVDLVKYNFIPKEDRKHKQNLRMAVAGVVVAIILGIVGVWSPFDDSSEKISRALIENTASIKALEQVQLKNADTFERIYEVLSSRDSTDTKGKPEE